ncbi:MAG: precorrin-8X methylmutase [Eubacteriales bacterium]|nr:precorrin-8X methylmutase [Eubacteriales bacterium]
MRLDGFEIVKPEDIERRSFEIITEELGDTQLIAEYAPIIKRCIHTSADFEYAHSLRFSPGVLDSVRTAIRGGAHIVTDTQMGKSGINKTELAKYGGEVRCYMSDADVAATAKENGSTRAVASMDKAAADANNQIFAIGNAPTALVRLAELIEAGKIKPALIIGAPVGFVNVVQAKELIMRMGVPYIVAAGRKGGSNIAACIVNAILYEMRKEA